MIAVHVIWGERVAQRKAEVKALADVYKYVQAANGDEEDVLLVGDFNRNPTDADAYSRIMAIPSMTRLFQFPQKSHIKDSSLYDNIFFQKDAVKEYLNRSGIDKPNHIVDKNKNDILKDGNITPPPKPESTVVKDEKEPRSASPQGKLVLLWARIKQER